jgi:hypothetical protein
MELALICLGLYVLAGLVTVLCCERVLGPPPYDYCVGLTLALWPIAAATLCMRGVR